MAFASSIQEGQIPVGCQLCEGGNKIQWKCIKCCSLMCDKCKDSTHLKIAKDHKILNINDIGKPEGPKDSIIFRYFKCYEHSHQDCCLFCNTCNKLICPTCITTKVHKEHELIEEEAYNKGKVELNPEQQSEIKLEISKEYTTDLQNIQYIAVCSGGSMWMGDNLKSKLQHVKLRENKPEVITSSNTKIYGIAKTHLNNILVTTTGETKLKLINTTGEITDSRYDVKPLYPISIHVTSDHRVIIGAKSPGEPFPATGRRVVVVMDPEGKQLEEYEHDNHKKPLFSLPRFHTSTKRLFTYPYCVSSTSNGNVCVVDWLDYDGKGRVEVLSPGGNILGTYTGHPEVNTKKDPFKPRGILTTPSDNIVVTDMNNHSFHILTDQGQSITYYNLRDMGILYPFSLALSATGTIYIGCVSEEGSPDTTKANIYELNYSGF
ncbi:TRIM2_3 [Mytilus coruscus]|uniref:TRIM2_3 n=1 Tax=Mytilus coruscus TaxID=42192 RepID=A0A6J8BER8_MYTCO|nr:TRIM2_3 [Mytilus coruscus]